jgi:hypothetical protein
MTGMGSMVRPGLLASTRNIDIPACCLAAPGSVLAAVLPGPAYARPAIQAELPHKLPAKRSIPFDVCKKLIIKLRWYMVLQVGTDLFLQFLLLRC